jgi:hypothetical protein
MLLFVVVVGCSCTFVCAPGAEVTVRWREQQVIRSRRYLVVSLRSKLFNRTNV